MTPSTIVVAVEARKNTPATGTLAARPKKPQPVPLRRAKEGEFIRAIDSWLNGEPWSCADACFRPYHGLNVRLRACGDQLLEDGVPVLSRHPTALLALPEGARTTNRTEAQALCAVAVRGDAWRYR